MVHDPVDERKQVGRVHRAPKKLVEGLLRRILIQPHNLPHQLPQRLFRPVRRHEILLRARPLLRKQNLLQRPNVGLRDRSVALQLAVDTDAAGSDQQLLDAAQDAYTATVAAATLTYKQDAADADGDEDIADAQATDDYVDEVYGQDGDYETWQNGIDAAENAYDLAQSTARESRDTNLSAHDAVLESGLADTFADALEQLALDYPSPWATRAAADARAESDKASAEQTAKATFDTAVATAQADFNDAAANAEQARSEAQTDALCTTKQSQSTAAVTKATNQSATNNTAAFAGAGMQKKPEQATPPEEPADATEAFGELSQAQIGCTTGVYVSSSDFEFMQAWSKRSTNGIAVARPFGGGLEAGSDDLRGLADDASAAVDFEIGLGMFGQPAVGQQGVKFGDES